MQLLNATKNIFSDLKSVLQQLDKEAYNKSVDTLSDSTIGQHTRHTIEFFQCLHDQGEQGVINYDKRSHDHLMEENPDIALQTLERIVSDYENMPGDKSLLLETTFNNSEDDYTLIRSSYYREWSYVLEHAIHHMAIIRIGLKAVAPAISIPDNFGIGSATIKFRQRQCAQ